MGRRMLTKRIKDIFDKHNGILTLKQAVDHGLSKESLRRAYLRGDLAKLKGGIYLLDNSYSDELYTTQLRYPKGIYSHETAVMLHSLSTYSPFVYHMTFPRGYNLNNPEQQHIYPHHMTLTKINIGVKSMESWHGNHILVTNLERTVVDMLTNKNAFPGIVDEMIDNYLWMEDKDIKRLKRYAKIFGAEKQIEGKVLEFAK